MLSAYGNEVAPSMKSARNIAYNISNLLKWWGDKTAAQISMKSCKEYAETRPSQAAAADLKILKVATDYRHKSEYGPLNFQPVIWRPKPNAPKDRWLTKSEAARLLKAAKPNVHLRRFILLGLYTGSRPGNWLSLTWDQVDLQHGSLRRTLSAQDAKKRAPPVRLGRRILAHLRRWRRLDGQHIKYVCHYEGRAVEDPHGSWAGNQGRRSEGCNAPHATPYSGDVDGSGRRAAMGVGRVLGNDDQDPRKGLCTPSSGLAGKGREHPLICATAQLLLRLCNSWKARLLPRQDTACEVGTVMKALLLRRKRGGHRPPPGAAGKDHFTPGRIRDGGRVEGRERNENGAGKAFERRFVGLAHVDQHKAALPQAVGDILRRQVVHLETAGLGIFFRHLRVPAIANTQAYVFSSHR